MLETNNFSDVEGIHKLIDIKIRKWGNIIWKTKKGVCRVLRFLFFNEKEKTKIMIQTNVLRLVVGKWVRNRFVKVLVIKNCLTIKLI